MTADRLMQDGRSGRPDGDAEPPQADWFGDPGDADVAGEFAPADRAAVGEPETYVDARLPRAADVGEANIVDVAEQRAEVPVDEDGYESAG